MVSSTGARLLVVPLVIALGQLLSSSLLTFVGTSQLRLSPGRQQKLQGSKVRAHYFKKLLNRKEKANVVETAPDNLDAAEFHSTDAGLEEAALEAAEPAPLGSIPTLHAQIAKPAKTYEPQLEPVVNLKIDDAVKSQPAKAQEAAAVESTRETNMDDIIFKVAEAESPVTSLKKNEDDIYDFFVELTDKIESLWNARTAMA